MTDSISPTTSPRITPVAANALNALNAPSNRQPDSGFSTLDQGDFLRLLTVQLQQQDPLEPVDNKDMLAQMAQFSGLAGTTTTNATLEEMSGKLDALIEAQRQSAAANHAYTYNS
ncbi:flagellar hook assembly protein FlgD [Parerythrobacter jejuensis]|uniref:Basal-body rod modification protein FlgD n=1 Tax=Parerythrobacter jejuensis TaxID=795812 RepID=A0A845ANW4_9SPHN|nr:flagellar hook capping FlgD N-terminal domain-containing protein [Parerythrobacter jejuensis]MXP30595.1 flagellar biosynthesis protein FlgD [Parerythrobacter jejuensis]MXP33355.1 flagellar biosynthesis protein FlgD [Parerythrobacter jejuensis]